MSLLQSLLGTVANDQIADQIAKATGLSPEQTKKAVSLAMPVLMSGLANNATNEKWANDLDQALTQHDGSILDNINIGDLLNSDDGQKIVGHILWSKTTQAEETIAKETGADNSQIATILKIAWPILMWALSKEKKTQWLDLSGLASLLSNEKKNAKSDGSLQSILFDFIDQNDDGSIIDDVIGFASKMLQNNKK